MLIQMNKTKKSYNINGLTVNTWSHKDAVRFEKEIRKDSIVTKLKRKTKEVREWF